MNRRSDILLLGFILLSLLLHLWFMALLPESALVPEEPPKKPVYIDLRPPAPVTRELDVPPPPEPPKPRETPAKRLGPADQEVRQEVAPQGEDSDDLRPKTPAAPKAQAPPPPRPAPKAAPKPPPKPVSKPEVSRPPPAPSEIEPWRRPGTVGPARAPSTAPVEPSLPPVPERPVPSPERLKNLDLLASAQSAAVNVSDQWRQKYREDVQEGEAEWLDMEKDILISFFQRFRNQVYMVWNYPAQARELGQEGVCLLRVTITRDGAVKDVVLKESSGYDLLDYEAQRAVRKGASYGPLPKAYPRDELHIMVFFKYELTRSRPFIY